ncbi:MAG: GntR family transcriptional regulator [Gemmobacter sp.]|nr:GntR family transcriptional regulator [Gemmobacter sp.]
MSGPDLIVRDILRGLTEARFVPGQRLIETDLMARYGVGRSTVREALGRLAAEGVVRLAPYRGAQIRLLTRMETADVLRVAGVLLGLAARQAAESVAAGAETAGFAQAAQAFLDVGGADARARYYRKLTRLADNAELARLLPSMQVHLIRAQLGATRPNWRGDHNALVAAVLMGDGDRAELSAQRHVQRQIEALPSLPDDLFAQRLR